MNRVLVLLLLVVVAVTGVSARRPKLNKIKKESLSPLHTTTPSFKAKSESALTAHHGHRATVNPALNAWYVTVTGLAVDTPGNTLTSANTVWNNAQRIADHNGLMAEIESHDDVGEQRIAYNTYLTRIKLLWYRKVLEQWPLGVEVGQPQQHAQFKAYMDQYAFLAEVKGGAAGLADLTSISLSSDMTLDGAAKVQVLLPTSWGLYLTNPTERGTVDAIKGSHANPAGCPHLLKLAPSPLAAGYFELVSSPSQNRVIFLHAKTASHEYLINFKSAGLDCTRPFQEDYGMPPMQKFLKRACEKVVGTGGTRKLPFEHYEGEDNLGYDHMGWESSYALGRSMGKFEEFRKLAHALGRVSMDGSGLVTGTNRAAGNPYRFLERLLPVKIAVTRLVKADPVTSQMLGEMKVQQQKDIGQAVYFSPYGESVLRQDRYAWTCEKTNKCFDKILPPPQSNCRDNMAQPFTMLASNSYRFRKYTVTNAACTTFRETMASGVGGRMVNRYIEVTQASPCGTALPGDTTTGNQVSPHWLGKPISGDERADVSVDPFKMYLKYSWSEYDWPREQTEWNRAGEQISGPFDNDFGQYKAGDADVTDPREGEQLAYNAVTGLIGQLAVFIKYGKCGDEQDNSFDPRNYVYSVRDLQVASFVDNDGDFYTPFVGDAYDVMKTSASILFTSNVACGSTLYRDVGILRTLLRDILQGFYGMRFGAQGAAGEGPVAFGGYKHKLLNGDETQIAIGWPAPDAAAVLLCAGNAPCITRAKTTACDTVSESQAIKNMCIQADDMYRRGLLVADSFLVRANGGVALDRTSMRTLKATATGWSAPLADYTRAIFKTAFGPALTASGGFAPKQWARFFKAVLIDTPLTDADALQMAPRFVIPQVPRDIDIEDLDANWEPSA